ncbi:MAG: hypothetical protein MHMPM18_002489 [Marteilia pararefringens]
MGPEESRMSDYSTDSENESKKSKASEAEEEELVDRIRNREEFLSRLKEYRMEELIKAMGGLSVRNRIKNDKEKREEDEDDTKEDVESSENSEI